MSFKKVIDGNYYFFPRDCSGTEFVVKKHSNSEFGEIILHTTCPKELVDKKVRLKLEIVSQ